VDWPIIEGQFVETHGEGSSTVYGTQISGSAFANVKGAWAQLGTMAAKSGSFLLSMRDANNGQPNPFSGLLDIGIDPAGGTSYTVVVPNIYFGPVRGPIFDTWWPVPIPAGATVAARLQGSTASPSIVRVRVTIYPTAYGWATPPRLQHAADYGTVTGSSTGTQIDPGGTANTKGSWVQLIASTTYPTRWLGLISHMENSNVQVSNFKLDIGVGGSGSEVVIVADKLAEGSSLSDTILPANLYRSWLSVPQGSRLAVRAQCSITDATDRLFKCALYGVS
jgi:hypothetical protein